VVWQVVIGIVCVVHGVMAACFSYGVFTVCWFCCALKILYCVVLCHLVMCMVPVLCSGVAAC